MPVQDVISREQTDNGGPVGVDAVGWEDSAALRQSGSPSTSGGASLAGFETQKKKCVLVYVLLFLCVIHACCGG